MKIAVPVSRIALGLVFLAAGVMCILMSNTTPPAQPGLAGTFTDVFFASRWIVFVAVIEGIAGTLLLINRYVPLALTALAAVLYNILVFHVTMMPSGLPLPIVLVGLWIVVAQGYRASFIPLMESRAVTASQPILARR